MEGNQRVLLIKIGLAHIEKWFTFVKNN